MRWTIATILLVLVSPAGTTLGDDTLSRRFATEAQRGQAPAPPAEPPVASESTRPGEQFFGEQPAFPSPNEARRPTTVQFISTSKPTPEADEAPVDQPAAPVDQPTQFESAAPPVETQVLAPMQLEPPSGRPLPSLDQPGQSSATSDRLSSPMASIATIGGSLAVVLSLFFALAWLMRRNMPRGTTRLPDEIVQVLGRTTLGNRQPVQLIRCGNKLILLATTPSGLTPLTEITDPMEVDRLAGLCLQTQPYSTTQAFGQVLHHHGRDSGGHSTGNASMAGLNDLAASRLEQLRAQTSRNG